MKKNNIISKLVVRWLGALALIFYGTTSYAQDPVTVSVLAVHSKGNVQYTYQVSNHTSARGIGSVSIGNRGIQPPDPVIPTNTQPELTIYPAESYWGQPSGVGDNRNEAPRLGGVYTSPPGWIAEIMSYGETSNFSVDWNVDFHGIKISPVIYPSQTSSFGVTVPFNDDPRSPYSMSDPAYLNGHFTVEFNDNDEPGAYTGSIVPIDTTPPTLSVELTPNTLWPPNNKQVFVTATISVKDDYDPEPEIKLESITANETLAANDIQDAQLQTDDRSFSLVAKRAGTNLAGRVYTVTYSATDGSGNKATDSATVTVPHDQGK